MNIGTDHPFCKASRYIESIRNASKKQYARDYYQWIRSGRTGDSPERPVDKLSYMGAQAVRMTLDKILPE